MLLLRLKINVKKYKYVYRQKYICTGYPVRCIFADIFLIVERVLALPISF